jgi:aspartyl-tRNA(Asn)/glutamyl-tRNA(Gln) amidotransferase subunit A
MARDVHGCIGLMQALAPGFAVSEREVSVGVTWVEHAEPLVRARVEAAAATFARSRPLSFPEPVGTTPLFMHEVAGVHRELIEEHGELYGDNPRTKIERCLAVSEADAAAAGDARREYERLALEALDGVDLLLTPTLMFVAPPADIEEIAWRERLVRFTYPFNLLGWPALALPAGPAEDGLPASVQLVGRRGDDARVLAAALALEEALRGA